MYYQQKYDFKNIEVIPAPVWRRVGAASVDILVLYGLLWVPYINFALMIGYGLVRDSWKRLGGKSIGKRLFGLKVMSTMSQHDIYTDYVSDISRNLYLLPAFIDFPFIFFSKLKRRLGDKKAYTIVVKDTPELKEYNERVYRNSRRYVNPVDNYDSYNAL